VSKKKCGVPSLSLGPCDLPYGHEGDMHVSAGDGFHAKCGTCREHLVAFEWAYPPEGVFGYVCAGCAPK
jgi:hypothetical protein